MRTVIARIFDYSLDGIIAGEGTGFFDFCRDLPDDQAQEDRTRAFYLGADVHIMGRKHYQDAAQYFPGADDHAMGITTSVIRAYYDSWTTGDFGTAVSLLADGLIVEVPVNQYPTAESFGAALKGFGSLAAKVELHAAMSDGDDGMLLYDMDVSGLGTLRVAEHFTVRDGRIVRIRQVHDTAALREAGFVD